MLFKTVSKVKWTNSVHPLVRFPRLQNKKRSRDEGGTTGWDTIFKIAERFLYPGNSTFFYTFQFFHPHLCFNTFFSGSTAFFVTTRRVMNKIKNVHLNLPNLFKMPRKKPQLLGWNVIKRAYDWSENPIINNMKIKLPGEWNASLVSENHNDNRIFIVHCKDRRND